MLTGFFDFLLRYDQRARTFKEGAAVEQAGERIGGCRGALHANLVILDHDEDKERGADRINDGLERKHLEPALRQMLGKEDPHRDRHQEDRFMQQRHRDAGKARAQRTAPLPPQLKRDRECVERDDDRARRGMRGFVVEAGKLRQEQPGDGAGECRQQAACGARGTGAHRSRSCRTP